MKRKGKVSYEQLFASPITNAVVTCCKPANLQYAAAVMKKV